MKEHTLTVSIFVRFTKAIHLKPPHNVKSATIAILKKWSAFLYLQLTFWRCNGFLFKLRKLKHSLFLVNFPKVSLILEIRSKIIVPNLFFYTLADFNEEFRKDSLLGLLLFLISNNKWFVFRYENICKWSIFISVIKIIRNRDFPKYTIFRRRRFPQIS